MPDENCANCRNGKPNEFGYVKCRWRLPLFVREEDVHWPMTRPDDWCSQWKPKRRVVVQIVVNGDQLTALADDGTIWDLMPHGWHPVSVLPPAD